MLQNLAVEVRAPGYWLAALEIVWINILLSGDNALVIAMACRGLQPAKRTWGMFLGALAAVVLRIVFTGIVATLMHLPYLKIAGGAALVYIAIKMLVPEAPDENEIEAVEHLWRAIWIVMVADIIMSLDNVIAIAAAARGSLSLMIIGLGVSIPLIVAGAALIMTLLDRLPMLIWGGGALLGWIAGDVIASDPVIAGPIATRFGSGTVRGVEIGAAAACAILSVAAGWMLRRARPTSTELTT